LSDIILDIFISIILIFSIIELFTFYIIRFVNKKFQWLIISRDKKPHLSKNGLEKFFTHGYDSELGWIRKPNTYHDENGKYGKTRWNINNHGARVNPNFDSKISKISCFGDSFAFSRQVNDNETWLHHLSSLKNSNISNFGVGNYGIDQALLRLKRDYEIHKPEIVFLAVVPDTISRIVSMWKHYYEYGNTFGFKPRYVISNKNELTLIKNPINNESKFSEYKNHLKFIQENDFFYNKKFKQEILHFPYSFTIFKNFPRAFSIISSVLKLHFGEKSEKLTDQMRWTPMKIIMKQNLLWRIKLYKDHKTVDLFSKIIDDYIEFANSKNFLPILIFLPQKDDVNYVKNNSHFYESFLKKITGRNNLIIIDTLDELLKAPNLDNYYSDNNEYGGHFSKEGNEKIASIIYDKLKRHHL
tara:strand:+ start:1670 stop:2911 length:1242 start_codon:yes stop_codon:yes gene_type:complete